MVLVFSTGTGTPSGTGTGNGSCTRTGTGNGTGTSTGSTGDGGGWGGVWGVPSLAGPYLNFITELIPLLIYMCLIKGPDKGYTNASRNFKFELWNDE